MKEIDYREIGLRIREARKMLHLTQEVASEYCDITPSYYGNLERGDKVMSVETLMKISQGLHVSKDYLLFGDEGDAETAITAVVENVQRECDEKQFERYMAIIEALSLIVHKL